MKKYNECQSENNKTFVLKHKKKVYKSKLIEEATPSNIAVYTFGHIPDISDDRLDFWFESGVPHTNAKIKDGSCFVNMRDYNIKREN